MSWFARLLGRRPVEPVAAPPPEPPAQQSAPSAQAAAAPAGPAWADATAFELDRFRWLTDREPVEGLAMSPEERRLLVALDAVLDSEDLRAQLLPRARSIVPQLLHSLRDDTQSTQSLAARVARDPNLVVEVIRMANSTGYRADAPVIELPQAIARLGTEGLRRAIARVLLKPIFDAQSDRLLGRASERLWQQSDLKAAICLQQAAVGGVDRFEAYLAGLMHNVGWTAALRAIDRSSEGEPAIFCAEFVKELAPRRDRLFAVFVRSWDLSPSLSAVADEVLAVGFHGARQHLALLLTHADRLATAQLLQQERERAAGGAGT